MNIAKPPGGFRVVLAPSVAAFVEDLLDTHPDLEVHWRAVIARLRDAAHRMGQAVDGHPGRRAAVIQPSHDGPLIKIAWRVLGDTVTVVRADF